jgi:uncharacterized protein YuzE
MNERYLEVTYRKGRPLAAYMYLPRRAGDKCARTVRADEGLLVDWSADGRPIGVEILSPAKVSVEQLNRVLTGLSLPPLTANELPPMVAA